MQYLHRFLGLRVSSWLSLHLHVRSLSTACVSDDEGILISVHTKCRPGDSFMLVFLPLSWFNRGKLDFPSWEQFPKSYEFPFGEKWFFPCSCVVHLEDRLEGKLHQQLQQMLSGVCPYCLHTFTIFTPRGSRWASLRLCWRVALRLLAPFAGTQHKPEVPGDLHFPEATLNQWLIGAVA